MNDPRILIATDLDRTLLPNGAQPESPGARRLFSGLAGRPEVLVAYVSGRDQVLVKEAIGEFSLPLPDYVIGDVGTSLYDVGEDGWQSDSGWADEISPDWKGLHRKELQVLLRGVDSIWAQEEHKQNNYKLSYYSPLDVDKGVVLGGIERILESQGICANVIWSIDEPAGLGLIDVLPGSATKLHALEYLTRSLGLRYEHVVFAGDSGNDMQVLVSHVQSVLVANASDEVRREATKRAKANGTSDALYLARGGYLGMNGNYAAGIVEGVCHFVPEAKGWL